MRRIQLSILLLSGATGLTACADSNRASPMCGLARLTGPLMVLEGFGRGDGLANPPTGLPGMLFGRFVGGPTASVLISHAADGQLIASVDSPVPEQANPGFGVLVVSRALAPLGILIHDGMPVRGASQLGTIEVGDTILPLLGIRVTPTAIETPDCRLFVEN